MRFVYKTLLTSAAFLIFLTSCSSKQHDKATNPQNTVVLKPLDTKALLAYDPKNADKRIDSFILQLHKTRGFNGNVLVVTATEFSSFSNISNTYTGFIIDQKTGKVIAQKELLKGSEQYYMQPVFLIAPDGSSFKIAVRTSGFTKGIHNPLLMFKMNKVAEEYFTTTDFQLLEFSGSLDVKSTIKPVLEQGYFLGGVTNKNGDVFFMTDYSQGYIKIAKYENGKTTPVKVLQQTVNINDDIIANLKDMHLFTSKTDPQALFFAATYFNGNKDRELDVFKFNFKTGTIGSNSQIMDKPYLKDLAKAYVPFSKKFDDVTLGGKDEMKIRNMVENDGKLIVALSSYTVYSNAQTGHSSISAFDLLVNVYDDKTNLQFQQIIPRSYSSISMVRLGIGMHCKNNILYLTANNNKGIIGYKALYGQVDLKTGSIINITGIEKNNIKRSYAIDPYGSFWFDNQFVLSYMEEKGLFDTSEDAHMQLLNY